METPWNRYKNFIHEYFPTPGLYYLFFSFVFIVFPFLFQTISNKLFYPFVYENFWYNLNLQEAMNGESISSFESFKFAWGSLPVLSFIMFILVAYLRYFYLRGRMKKHSVFQIK